MTVNWKHLEKMYNDVKNYEKPSGHPTSDNPDDIPVVVLDFKKQFKSQNETITGKVLLIDDNPVLSVGFHYPLTDLMESGRFICNENTTKYAEFECMGCQLARSKSYKPFIDLGFNIYNKSIFESIPELRSINNTGKQLLRDEAKRMLNLRSKNFFYILMAPKPYNGALSIVRIMPEDISIFIKSMLDSKDKGSDLFSITGYDCVLAFDKNSNGFYTLSSVDFANQKSTLTSEVDSVKKLKEFIKRFDIYDRLKISETAQEDQMKLIKYWFNLQKERLHKEFNIVLSQDKESFTYNGQGSKTISSSPEEDKPEEAVIESPDFMDGVESIEEDISKML